MGLSNTGLTFIFGYVWGQKALSHLGHNDAVHSVLWIRCWQLWGSSCCCCWQPPMHLTCFASQTDSP
jgi:hypothetical protein